jgi:hypothetical protein
MLALIIMQKMGQQIFEMLGCDASWIHATSASDQLEIFGAGF